MKHRYLLLILTIVPFAYFELAKASVIPTPAKIEFLKQLERNDIVHYTPPYVAGAALVPTFAFIVLLLLIPKALRGAAQYWKATALTATLGIVLLFALRYVSHNISLWWMPTSKFGYIVFGLLELIGSCYQLVENPRFGFFGQWAGYTFGVGLAEELVKLSLALIVLRGSSHTPNQVALAGLGAGIGFGVAEGFYYSIFHYNPGSDVLLLYVVRFVSCVFSHGLLTGAAALALEGRDVDWDDSWHKPAIQVLLAVFPSVFLHGLFNVLVTYDYGILAIAVEVTVFCWFAHQYIRNHELMKNRFDFSDYMDTQRSSMSQRRRDQELRSWRI